MSAELFVRFTDIKWYKEHRKEIKDKISKIKTCVFERDDEFWLKGVEDLGNENRWRFDVRLFTYNEYVFLEISSHPPSIEQTLSSFLTWLRLKTEIKIEDEDEVISTW